MCLNSSASPYCQSQVPPELCVAHPVLSGARALKCLCLLCHEPYLATGEQALRQIYNMCFVDCTAVPVTEGALCILQRI